MAAQPLNWEFCAWLAVDTAATATNIAAHVRPARRVNPRVKITCSSQGKPARISMRVGIKGCQRGRASELQGRGNAYLLVSNTVFGGRQMRERPNRSRPSASRRHDAATNVS